MEGSAEIVERPRSRHLDDILGTSLPVLDDGFVRVIDYMGTGCLRCLLLVMCTHPFAREAFTLHLARSEGHERYFDCNLMHRRVLASSYQHLMAEAPSQRPVEDGFFRLAATIEAFWAGLGAVHL